MITPTIGRKVWLWTDGDEVLDPTQALDATIVFVNQNGSVNLVAWGHNGAALKVFDVPLRDPEPTDMHAPGVLYATWMPYQVGQAKKDAPTLKSTTSTVGDVSHTETNVYGTATRPDLDAMVDRFLTWRLPADFAPDCGISFDGRNRDARGFPHQWPTGTNLLHAGQARAMLEQVLGAANANIAPPDDGTDAAVALCQHLDRVGRASSQRTITVNGGTFNVLAELIYRAPEPDTRPKSEPDAAAPVETAVDKQTAHQFVVAGVVNNIVHPDQAIEAEIQAKGLTAPRVTPQDLNHTIVHTAFVKHVSVSGQVLRWAVLTTKNGFAVTGKPSCSVSSANDDAEIGEQVAKANAVSELWPLLGYALRERLAAGTVQHHPV